MVGFLKEYHEEAKNSAVTQEEVMIKVGLYPLDQGAKVRVTNAVSDTSQTYHSMEAKLG